MDRKKMGRAARNKGKNFERFCANSLKNRGFKARRGVQHNGLLDHDLKTDIPFNFECKAVENLNINKAYKQACDDALVDNSIPVVLHKKNNKEPLATMSMRQFIDLLQWALGVVDASNTMELDEVRNIYRERYSGADDL